MIYKGCSPNVVTYISLIHFLDGMINNGLNPDVVTLITHIGVRSWGKQVAAKEFFIVRKHAQLPDLQIYAIILDGHLGATFMLRLNHCLGNWRR